MIKNIVFDMGNVLILYDSSRYLKAFAEDKANYKILLDEVFCSEEWIHMDRGDWSEERAIASICARVPQHLHATVASLFQNWHRDIPPVPEMEALVKELKAAGYRLYLLSNTSKRYHSFREHIPALRFFNGEFISADWGLLKPDEAIYRAFVQHFNLLPAECFFVDDSAANLESARRIGMEGFVFHQKIAPLRAALQKAGVTL